MRRRLIGRGESSETMTGLDETGTAPTFRFKFNEASVTAHQLANSACTNGTLDDSP